jgi:hypothetical protein
MLLIIEYRTENSALNGESFFIWKWKHDHFNLRSIRILIIYEGIKKDLNLGRLISEKLRNRYEKFIQSN